MAQRKALAWLAEQGVALETLTPEVKKRWCDFFDEAPEGNASLDVTDNAPDARDAYLGSGALFLTGKLQPAVVGEKLAKDRLEVALDFTAARAVGKLAVQGGATEASVAEALGVDRMTLRKWLGKR